MKNMKNVLLYRLKSKCAERIYSIPASFNFNFKYMTGKDESVIVVKNREVAKFDVSNPKKYFFIKKMKKNEIFSSKIFGDLLVLITSNGIVCLGC